MSADFLYKKVTYFVYCIHICDTLVIKNKYSNKVNYLWNLAPTPHFQLLKMEWHTPVYDFSLANYLELLSSSVLW